MFTVSKTVSDETLNCIITIESAGRVACKASTSSALGLGQFLNGTWLNVVGEYHPELLKTHSKTAVLAMRTNPAFAIEMLARFTEDNQRIIGMKCTGGDLYLAHFLGAHTAQYVCAAPPSEPVAKVVSAAAIQANRSVMEGKTCGQVRAWAAKRMAQSSGHAWVAKYYHPKVEPVPVPEPRPDCEPEPEATEDIPDTQEMPPVVEDTPAATATKDDTEIIVGKQVLPESWGEWVSKLFRSKIQWASSTLGGISLASLAGELKDPRVLIVVGVVAICCTIVIVVERGRKP
jgi:hypothetical protein